MNEYVSFAAGVITLVLALFMHELAHRKIAWMHNVPAHIRFYTRPRVYIATHYGSCAPTIERRIVLGGVLFGLVPYMFLALFGAYILWWGVWGSFLLYVRACLFDFEKLEGIEHKRKECRVGVVA